MIRLATHLSIATLATMIGTSASATVIDSSFTNLDFDDAPGVTHFPDGFDASPDIPGWEDNGPTSVIDAGVESVGAWWGPLEGQSAFLAAGDLGWNTSSYVIQAGDIFDVTFFAKGWGNNEPNGEITISLYYGDPGGATPTNIIGTYSSGMLPSSIGAGATWFEHTTSIAASVASEGSVLGVLVQNTGTQFANLDEISIGAVPEPTSLALLGLGGLMMSCRRRK